MLVSKLELPEVNTATESNIQGLAYISELHTANVTNSTKAVLLDELIFAQLVKIFTTIMESEYVTVFTTARRPDPILNR
jgi:poly(A) polymerase Pap1